jgi:hypothetical protein
MDKTTPAAMKEMLRVRNLRTVKSVHVTQT